MTRKQIENMTEKEFLLYLKEIEEEDTRNRMAEVLEERNRKINKLLAMDTETVGKAYICYAKAKFDDEDIGIESDSVLDAYMLICDIEAVNICY